MQVLEKMFDILLDLRKVVKHTVVDIIIITIIIIIIILGHITSSISGVFLQVIFCVYFSFLSFGWSVRWTVEKQLTGSRCYLG